MRKLSNIDVRGALKNLALVAGLMFAAAMLVPSQFSLSKYKLPASEVEFRGPSPQLSSTRFHILPADGAMNEQFSKRQDSIRRFHFKFDETFQGDVPRTIYVPSSGGQIRLALNGGYAGLSVEHGFFAPSFGTHWKVYDFPRYFFIPGDNRINIYLADDPVRAGVRQIFFGPTDKITKAVQQQERWMAIMPNIVRIGFGLCALLCVTGVMVGRRKLDYLLMGSLSLLLFLSGLLPLAGGTDAASAFASFLRFGCPLVVLIGLIATLIIRKDRWKDFYGLYPGLVLFALLGPLFALIFMYAPIFWDPSIFVATLALLSALPLIFIISSTDLIADWKHRTSSIRELSLKVSQQTEELDEKTQLIVSELRQRALLEERQRFTRDIHDGIGGKLLSLLLQVRTGELNNDHIAEEIQSGIHDLRMVVDSIDQIGEDVSQSLETFRVRAKSQLRTSGIELNWTQPDNIQGSLTGKGNNTLNLFRLLQEAVTNVVRHAKAKQVDIVISQPENFKSLEIKVIDDGVGIKAKDYKTIGNGLKNMQARANALKADLKIGKRPKKSGTQISLNIPLDE